MSARRFVLLKDLPDVKAGTPLVWEEKKYGGEYTVLGDSPTMSNYYHFNQYLVENTPTWFKEIIDKEPFVWTDELVDEYALRMEKESMTTEKFKASKQFSSSTPSGTANGVLNTDEWLLRKAEKELFETGGGLPEKVNEAVNKWQLSEFEKMQNNKETIRVTFVVSQGEDAMEFYETVVAHNKKEVTESKVKEIRDAIDRVLSGDNDKFWERIAAMTDDAISEVTKHKYTEKDLEIAFLSSRNGISSNHFESAQYKTFQDYKKFNSLHKS